MLCKYCWASAESRPECGWESDAHSIHTKALVYPHFTRESMYAVAIADRSRLFLLFDRTVTSIAFLRLIYAATIFT